MSVYLGLRELFAFLEFDSWQGILMSLSSILRCWLFLRLAPYSGEGGMFLLDPRTLLNLAFWFGS